MNQVRIRVRGLALLSMESMAGFKLLATWWRGGGAEPVTGSSRLRFNGVINRGGEKEWGQSRAEPSSTDKSRKFLTNSVHAADSDLSSERF
ncbi:hypothetical protein J6590_075564 [Homalodisca vitripennis]|nr:hypothetical protein J6590_097637 [Homalodisca vitripennis]KAG8329915.1 hypothetical protein J6590_075564 [Homalodisca vitripennis]